MLRQLTTDEERLGEKLAVQNLEPKNSSPKNRSIEKEQHKNQETYCIV